METRPHRSIRRQGLTLIELVVVLAVVAFGVSLFAPAVVQARQRGRKSQCANNLRRIGLAWANHEQAQGFLPSSGWGWNWTGDPDRGFGRTQPGGWAYDAIRFTEYSRIAVQGAGARDDAEKALGMVRANTTPIPFFHCPEKRPPIGYRHVRNGPLATNLRECTVSPSGCFTARIDYRANSGNVALGETRGPSGNRSTFIPPRPFTNDWTGVTFQVSELRVAQIEDGLGKTMALGEKYLDPNAYHGGFNAADDQSAYVGLDRDTNGYTASSTLPPDRRVNLEYLPRRDRRGLSYNWTFGGPHESGFNTLNCDMSVRFLPYEIDFVVFSLLGGRADGE